MRELDAAVDVGERTLRRAGPQLELAEQAEADRLALREARPPIRRETLVEQPARPAGVAAKYGLAGQAAQDDRGSQLVAERAKLRQAFLVEALARLAFEPRHRVPQRAQRERVHRRRSRRSVPEKLLDPTPPFLGVARDPEVLQRNGQAQPELGALGAKRPGERGTDVVVLRDDEVVAHRAFGLDVQVGALGQVEEELGVPETEVVLLGARLEQLRGQLPDRLERQKAIAARRLEQARFDERVQLVERRLRDRLGRLEREAAREDGKPGEHVLQARFEQLVAPLDGGTERALALRRVAAPGREQRQAAVEPLEQRRRAQRAEPRCGELQRERQSIEPAADRAGRLVRLEVRADGPCTLSEQVDRVVGRQSIEGVLELAGDSERCAAGHEHLRPWRRHEQLRHRGGRVQQVLEVVDEQQGVPVVQLGDIVYADRRGDGGGDQLGLTHAGERHEEHAAGEVADELGRHLETEPRLAAAAGTRQGDQARTVAEQRLERSEFLPAAYERAHRNRQVGRVQRPERRELALAELEEPYRRA